jgi:hypothetical protein
VDKAEEPMAYRWVVRPDSTYEIPPLGHPPLIAIGTGHIDVDETETAFTVQWGFPPEFDDFLDDAVWRLRDRFGYTVDRGYVARGDAKFTIEEPGRYELQTEVFAPAFRWVDASTGVVPRLFRGVPPITLDVYDGVLPAHLDDEGRRITGLQLKRSWSWRFGLRARELPEVTATLVGTFEIQGYGSEGSDNRSIKAPSLCTRPVEIRSVTHADSATGFRGRFVELLGEVEDALSAGAYDDANEMLAALSRLVSSHDDRREPRTLQFIRESNLLRLMRMQLWHASRPAATADELAAAHVFVRDIALSAEERKEEPAAREINLTRESGDSTVLEADLWEARLLVRQAIKAIEKQEARRAESFLKKAERIAGDLDGELLETGKSKDLHRILKAEHSIASRHVARRKRDQSASLGTDSLFAAQTYDVVTKARDLLDNPPAIYMPFTPWLRESLIRALGDLGWVDIATLELDRWMMRAPVFRTEQYQLRHEIAGMQPSDVVLRWASWRSRN